MNIANEILKAQNNLKECYDVCKSVDGVVLPDNKNFDNLPALIEQALNPFQKPSDWNDIRVDCPADSIALYAAHSADYSDYDNLGFAATCTGGYKVFIDGTQYGSTYASGTQCSITWSTSGITTGDDITTPSALKAHKIWIEPATEGNNITDFTGARVVSGSGYEDQGILWVHFNIDTSIHFQLGEENSYHSKRINAITAKNNTINISRFQQSCHSCPDLSYTPVFIGPQEEISCYSAFSYCSKLQKLNFKNIKVRALGNTFFACPSLLKLPKIDFSGAVFANRFVVNATSLKDTIIDMSSATGLRIVGIYGDSTHRINGLKGLRVSNEAPFDYATPPQINVNYTGLDRNALVQLFNDLPIVSAGQIISIVGATGASDLTADDEAIATAKGWTITK